jgi:hemolysin D
LLELDTAAPEADVMRLQGDLRAARLKADRARALLSAQQSGVLPVPQSTTTLTSVSPSTAESASQRQAQGMFIEYQARLERIDADIARRRAELTSGEELANKLEQTLPLARSRAQNLKELSEPGYVSRHTWMDKEQQKIEMEGDLNTQRSRIKETQAGLREAQAQRAMVAAEMRRQMLDQLSEGEQQAQAIGQELSKAQSRQRLMQVRAPIDGTVQQLAVNTIGGVVTPAQALMLLVPNQLRLEVDARLDNKDIGFVKAGQTVEVKIDTFPYTRYGVLRATVLHVSHDAVGDEKQGLTYLARIQLEQSQIQVDEKMVPLVPGMAVAAEIKTGRRRVLDYFLSPLLQYQHESFRER